jgi:Zn-finger nucleic acid-binding protein
MQEHTLSAHHGRAVAVDLCEPCQSLWFDQRENLQLTPGATLALFRVIGEHVTRPRPPVGEKPRCPRCRARLQRTQDMQRATRFEYEKCPKGHGRLVTFFDFLKEKDFVRPLTPLQVAELRRRVQMVHCSSCGGPIDLTHGSKCPHCASPLSMLDMDQAQSLIAQLREAERTDKPVDPALPLELARARRLTDEAFRPSSPSGVWVKDGDSLGLVGAGLSALVRMLLD